MGCAVESPLPAPSVLVRANAPLAPGVAAAGGACYVLRRDLCIGSRRHAPLGLALVWSHGRLLVLLVGVHWCGLMPFEFFFIVCGRGLLLVLLVGGQQCSLTPFEIVVTVRMQAGKGEGWWYLSMLVV